MGEIKSTPDEGSEPGLHHHCCHHHAAKPQLCHHREAPYLHPTAKDIYFRPDAGEGLWLPALLPLACISACAVAGASSSLPLALLAMQSCICCYDQQRSGFSRHIQRGKGESPGASPPRGQVVLVCGAVAAAVLCLAAGAGVVVSVVAVVVNAAVVRVVCSWLVTHHSRTFSVGEWLFVGECAGVCVSHSVYALLSGCSVRSPYTHCQVDAFIQLAVLVVGLLLLLLLLLPPHRSRSPLLLLPLVVVLGLVGIIWSSLLLGEFSPLWLLAELGGRQPDSGLRRPLLLGWWSFCTVIAWCVTSWVYRYRSVPVPAVRKVYHVLAVGVCVAGVVADAAFLHLASVAATLAALLLEVVRVLDVPLISPALTAAFSNFLDEKDRSGKLVLSPVYLLVGLCLPLWLLPLPIPYCLPCPNATPHTGHPNSMGASKSLGFDFRNPGYDSNSVGSDSNSPGYDPNFPGYDPNSPGYDPNSPGYDSNSLGSDSIDVNNIVRPCEIALLQLAGVLAVGIGDTFASIGGIKYGKHKYPGSNKSVEGSACGVGSQMAVVVLLVVCGVVEVGPKVLLWWGGVFATVLLAAMVEAFTNQVDNLALPLVTFVGFCWTLYFSGAL